MSNDELETADGYTESRDPETAVFMKRTADRYHECIDGEIACQTKSNADEYERVTLKKAIECWKEPCQYPTCTEHREATDREFETTTDSVPEMPSSPSRFFGTDGWRNKADLELAYWEYYWSLTEIAQWVGTNHDTISDAFEEFEIPKRSMRDSCTVAKRKKHGATLAELKREFPHPGTTERTDTENTSDETERITWGQLSGD